MIYRATCPQCRREITVKVDGRLRHHTDPSKPKVSTIFSPRCNGSDELPDEVTEP